MYVATPRYFKLYNSRKPVDTHHLFTLSFQLFRLLFFLYYIHVFIIHCLFSYYIVPLIIHLESSGSAIIILTHPK